MTNHYQHARNDHANATKCMKCIKPYGYKKSSLKSETTENESCTSGHTNPQNKMI